jgi:Ca-activated chloride channel family protein
MTVFQNSLILWGLLLLPFFFLYAFLSIRRKKQILSQISGEHKIFLLFPGLNFARQWLRWFLWISIFSLLLLAIARPRYGLFESEKERKGIYLTVALDVSTSMLAEDLSPNRLSRAKMAVQNVLKRLKNDQVALVVFAGSAHIAVPMTPDIGYVNMVLRTVDTEMPSEKGTWITEALRMAFETFPENRTGEAAIILISDGEDHEGEAVEIAMKAKDNRIFVHTLGIGNPQGTPIPLYENGKLIGYKKDENGQTILSKLNENMLREIASAGGGMYRHGINPGSSLDEIFTHIDLMAKEKFSPAQRNDLEERYLWFLWPALILLTLEWFLKEKSTPWWKRLQLFD